MTPAVTEWTRVANQPASTPTTSPLNVDPITMPTICGATSGADNRALSPSNTPSTAPRINPSTGLFIRCPPEHSLRVHDRAFTSNWLQTRFRRGSCPQPAAIRVLTPVLGLPAGHDRHDRAHDDVGQDEQDRRPVDPAV